MILAFIILFSAYLFCMMVLIFGFRKVPVFSIEDLIPVTRFSVVIPFRNEVENLPNILKSIETLKYPSEFFELIFVNDASEDISEKIVAEAIEKSRFSIKLIQNKRISNSPKKDAITEAIQNSRFEWIVTTDADCELPKNWLKTLDAFIHKNNPVMVCGPVIYETNGSFVENFQQLDGFSLQAVTIGSFGLKIPLLSNGANLAYLKTAFLEVKGFVGNDHIASGDDIFLLEKMKKVFPTRVHFLKSKEIIVSTKPQQTWKNVITQRIRWASKTSKQKNTVSLILGMLVFLVNISVLALPFFMIFDSENFIFYFTIFCFKTIPDYLIIKNSAKFFETEISNYKFQLQLIVYAAVLLIVVLGSFRGNYSWKGRNFQKQ